MTMWRQPKEWQNFSNCDIRHIIPPERLSERDIEEVQAKCFACKTRPECIKAILHDDIEHTGVWAASVFIPEVKLEHTTAEARETLDQARIIREKLADTIDDEIQRRGEF